MQHDTGASTTGTNPTPERSSTPNGGPRPISRRLQTVGDRSNWECTYCGNPLPRNPDAADHPTDPEHRATADHLVPRSKGGRSRLRNLVLACQSCNNLKGDTDLPDWLELCGLPTDLCTSRAVIAHFRAARAAATQALARIFQPA